jgi:hypothetical protein
MKELEEKAEQLIEKQRLYLGEVYSDAIEYDQMKLDDKDIIHSCIMGVNYTIELLENRKKDQNFVICIILNEAINEQIELKKILEGKL